MVTSDAKTTIPAGEFKARCLKLLVEVQRSGQTITITKRGKPVAMLVPLPTEKPRRLLSYLKGHLLREEDIVSPSGEQWEADRG